MNTTQILSQNHDADDDDNAARNKILPLRDYELEAQQRGAAQLPTERQAAQRLLKYAPGTFSPETWFDLQRCLPFWCTLRTAESVQFSWALLDKLVHELSLQQQAKRSSEAMWSVASALERSWADLLHQVLNNWRIVWIRGDTAASDIQLVTHYPPSVMWHKIETYDLAGLAPTEKSFYFLCDANQRGPQSSPDLALQLLQRCIQLHLHRSNSSGTEDNACAPTTDFFNSVLLTLARAVSPQTTNSKARNEMLCQQMEHVLTQMQSCNVDWNRRTYMYVMMGYAATCSEAGARHCQAWLDRMMEDYETTGRRSIQPNPHVFSIALSAWAKSKSPLASAQADILLPQMLRLKMRRRLDSASKANLLRCCNNALQCHGALRNAHGAQRAWQVLHDLQQHPQGPQPDHVTLRIVLSVLASNGQPDRAEQVLRQVLALPQPPPRVTLQTYFDRCITAWARYNNDDHHARLDKVVRARALLEEMPQHGLLASTATYNALFEVLAHATHSYAATTGEKILQHMEKCQVAPNVWTYYHILHAWARAGNVHRAEHWFQRLLLLEDETPSAENNQLTLEAFNVVLSAHNRSKSSQAAALAQEMLEHFVGLAERGDIELQPDLVSYTTVMTCWAKLVDFDRNKEHKFACAQRCLDVLRVLQVKARTGHDHLRPTVITYNVVLDAWARCGNPERVADLIEGMYQDARNGNHTAHPDVRSINALIKAWVMANDRPDAAQQAESLLRNMLEPTDNVRLQPTIVSYTLVMSAYARRGQPSQAESLLRELDERHKQGKIPFGPNRHAFWTVRKAWSQSKAPPSGFKAQALQAEMLKRFGPDEHVIKRERNNRGKKTKLARTGAD